jgi:hypothetical protein
MNNLRMLAEEETASTRALENHQRILERKREVSRGLIFFQF